MARKKTTRPPPGIHCKRCGQEITTGLVFLCGPRSWVPFCARCLYQSDNRMAVAIAATAMSEQELAEHMNVSVHTIRKWRQGKVKHPKQENMERLASLAGVTLDWLQGKEDNPGR